MSFSADSALEYLQRAHKKNRLAHAYLISGPAGSGKSDVAARLAAALNKTTPEKVLRAQAPDVFVTEPASRSRKIDRKSTRLNSSHRCISYAVFCLKKKKVPDER